MDPREVATVALDAAQGSPSQLVVMWKGGHSVHVLPATGTMVLGRAADADIPIDDASMSRRHATLHLGSPIRIEDHGGPNGVVIAGKKLVQGVPTPIPAGALVHLGAVLISLVEHQATAAAPKASSDLVVCGE